MEDEQNSPTVNGGGSSNGRNIAIVIVVLVVVGAIAFFALTRNSNANSVKNSATATSTDTNPATPLQNLTEDQVAVHNKKSDCWTIIRDKVYDITSYIPRHPGGDEILRACGVDGTSLFETRTTSDGEKVGSGTPHSATAENQLKQLLIGTITQ